MQRRAVIVIVLIVITIGALVALAISNKIAQDEELRKNTITDRDTGAVIRTGSTGVTGEAGISSVALFGTDSLRTKGMSNEQVRSLYESIQNYSVKNLKDEFTSVTIRPQDLRVSEGLYTSMLRLGQGENLVPVSIRSSGESVIVVINESSTDYGGPFLGVSGVPYENSIFSLKLKAETEVDITRPPVIQVSAPEGYRNGAVNKMKEFGYNTADFLFEFSGYEDPFKS